MIFSDLKLDDGGRLFEQVIRKSHNWGTTENLMFVVGATQAKMLAYIRKMIPGHFLLIPGVGAQGGSLKDVSEAALTADCGLLVNSSRGIIYASSGKNFAEKARENALELQQQMKAHLK
jgi:orotidine-5'-phosphate decarboxylase